jgi:hypothetical protein
MDEILKRINLDTLKEFLAGIVPEPENSDDCLVYHILGKKLPHRITIQSEGFDFTYIIGVIEGYDDKEYPMNNIDRQSLKYKLGYADGCYARRLLLGK